MQFEMITIAEIDEEINRWIANGNEPQGEKEDEDKFESRKKKCAKKVNEFKNLRRFLENEPKPEDLQKHLDALTNKRNLINDPLSFDRWITANPGASNDISKAKAAYHKELELPHINAQIKTLKYILQ